jgi:hypothetical protein
MLKRTIAAISVLAIAAATPVLAQTAAPSNAAPELSLAQIEQRLSADGFRILESEREARSVEIKGFDRQGRCRELHVDARTGDILRQESDDDCYDDDRRASRR